MNAADICFGIELETTMPVSDTTPIGAYHNGLPVSWLPTGWKAERDGSINASYGRKPCEFVSPILKGEDGLRSVMTAVDAIRERGGKVNKSCGIHVTVTFPATNAPALARLIHLIANHEKAIWASTGTKRRETNYYCKKIKSYGNERDAKRHCEADRYHLLNLTHLARGRNRIEIRAFSGSLNATKIAGYIMLVLGLVEAALKSSRRSSWNVVKKTGSTYCRGGEGEGEIKRLYYKLGWTKGMYKGTKRDTCYGKIAGEGIPTLKAIKKKLSEMAKKYDADSRF